MKRCVGLVLACLMVMGLLGCGAPQLKPDTSLPKLIIGSDTYPPYVYMDNNGDITGLDVEIAREALRRMGVSGGVRLHRLGAEKGTGEQR